MNQKCFDLNSLGSDQAIEQLEKDLADLRKARKLRPSAPSVLLPWVEWIQRHGMRKSFTYSQLAEALVRARGPRVERLKLRRFVQKHLPEVFKFRSQFKFNRNVVVAQENKNECKK